jgi:hypothetical protein
MFVTPLVRFDVYMRPFLTVMSWRSSVGTVLVLIARTKVGLNGLAMLKTRTSYDRLDAT